jgi:hypothetical protein
MANNKTVLREYQDEMQQKLSMAIKASDDNSLEEILLPVIVFILLDSIISITNLFNRFMH